MLLTVDIGNSAIKFGLFEGDTLSSRFSIPTVREYTPDELKLAVDGRMGMQIDAAMVCSVVPEVDSAVRDFLTDYARVKPVFVNNSFDFGLKVNYEPLESLGTDRLVAMFAAVEKYGAPCIVCSLGTATTIDVVSAEREFLGGVIAPGMNAMAEALHLKASKLPKVETSKPEDLLGNSTSESIRSGVYNGYLAMVGGLINQLRAEFGDMKVIAAGGNARAVSERVDSAVVVDENLHLDGLRILHASVR